MKLISAKEIKRRGGMALEEALENGPVHILKNNRPVCVVLEEEDYQGLARKPSKPESLLDWMLSKPATGGESPDALKQWLQEERNLWR